LLDDTSIVKSLSPAARVDANLNRRNLDGPADERLDERNGSLGSRGLLRERVSTGCLPPSGGTSAWVRPLLIVVAPVLGLTPELIALLLKRREMLGVNAEVRDNSQLNCSGLVGTGYDLESERRGWTPCRISRRSALFRGDLLGLASSRFLRLVALLLFGPRLAPHIAN
jgi:hypothetical protein